MEEIATEEEIDLCLEEARELYPEATDNELYELGAEIYEENKIKVE